MKTQDYSFDRSPKGRFKGLVVVVGLAILVAGLVLGTSGQAARSALKAPQKRPKGTLTISLAGDITYSDPSVARYDENIFRNVYDTLIMKGKKTGTYLPSIARSWKQVSARQYLFKLRSGIHFTNGEPVNARAVAFSVRRATHPISIYHVPPDPEWAGLSAKAVNATTVRVKTATIDPLAMTRLANLFIVPPKYIGRVGDSGFAKHPVGSGPFEWVSHVPDSSIALKANPHYWGGEPKVEKVVYKIIPDVNTAVSALETGAVDIATGLTPEEVAPINHRSCCKAISEPSASEPFLWFFPQSPQGGGAPLAKALVRKAINYAINRQAIIKYVLKGQGDRTSTIIPPYYFGYAKGLKPYPYNPAKAKKLLAQAGYPNGFKLNFEVPSSNGITVDPVEVGQAIAADLGKVGITANVKATVQSTIIQEKNGHTIAPLFIWRWADPDADPYNTFYGVLYSKSAYTLTKNAKIDELIRNTLTHAKERARIAPLAKLQKYVYNQALFGFLWEQHDVYGVSKHVHGFTPKPDGSIHLASISVG